MVPGAYYPVSVLFHVMHLDDIMHKDCRGDNFSVSWKEWRMRSLPMPIGYHESNEDQKKLFEGVTKLAELQTQVAMQKLSVRVQTRSQHPNKWVRDTIESVADPSARSSALPPKPPAGPQSRIAGYIDTEEKSNEAVYYDPSEMAD